MLFSFAAGSRRRRSTEPLAELSETQRNLFLTRLQSAKLVTVHWDAASMFVALDSHPLVREYFARQLQARPEVWREGNRRLYEHLCATTPDKPEPKLEDLQPLYLAVAHGCHAGLQQDSCANVYYRRIKRRDENYSSRQLGVFGSDLSCLACFFDIPWSRVSPKICENDQAWILNNVGYFLRGLGRLTEAQQPMEIALEMAVRQHDWKAAAVRASNLSELMLTLGHINKSIALGSRSIAYSDQSGDVYWRLVSRAKAGDALHQAGRRSEADLCFREVESLQKVHQFDQSQLWLANFRYYDMRLSQRERAAWLATISWSPDLMRDDSIQLGSGFRKPADASLGEISGLVLRGSDPGTPTKNLLQDALGNLISGRLAFYHAILNQSKDLDAGLTLDHAVDGFRRADQLFMVPHAFLTRAWFRSFTCKLVGDDIAQSDLDEAWEIAARGPMKLHMVDIQLHRARLFFREKDYPWISPQMDLSGAAKLISECGYHLRGDELASATLVIQEDDSKLRK